MDYVLDFNQINKNLLAMVGGKNASLGEMLKAGISVPPGFAVTTESYQEFLAGSRLDDEICDILEAVDSEDMTSLNKASAKAQALVESSPMPSAIADAIQESYTRLCERCNAQDLPVAVRSSATAEDLPNASFAGQQDTYLWVTGGTQVIRMVQKCWASLYTPRAISYRIKIDCSHINALMSVGVQKMVNSRTSGVMFTLNPTNGDPSKVMVEASWGFGEAVVSGIVTPDSFLVDKIVLEINERTISAKTIECVRDGVVGVTHHSVPSKRQTTPCLSDEEIKELVKIAQQIENHYGRPQDIEWAIDMDFSPPENIFIVQSRPETVWSQRPSRPVLHGKTGFELLMEKALTPIKVRK